MTATASIPTRLDQTASAVQANPFFTAETNDHEMLARWMLDQQEDETEIAAGQVARATR